MNLRSTRVRRQDIIFAVGIALTLILLLWKGYYGAGSYDEAFYSSIAYKLTKGDSLFANEWHGSQLYSLLVLPFIKLYHIFVGSNEGIILASRIVYSVLHIAVSTTVYLRLRKLGMCVVPTVLIYTLFIPYNVQALCYNNIGMECMTLFCVLIATNERRSKLIFVVSGFLYAMACLCQPLLVFIFVAALAVALVYSAIKHNRLAKYTLLVFAGMAILFIPIATYLLTTVGLSNVINSLSGILSDPEHTTEVSVLHKILYCVGTYLPKIDIPLLHINSIAFYCILYLLELSTVLLAIVFKRKKKSNNALFLIAVAVAAIYDIPFIYNNYVTNYYLFPWIFPGVVAAISSTRKSHVQMYLTVATFSVMHAMSFLLSNQGAYVINIGLAPLCLASIMLCTSESIKYIKAKSNKQTVALCIFVTMLTAVTVGAVAYSIVNKSIGDVNTLEQNSTIECGVYNGVHTSSQRKAYIENSIIEFKNTNLVNEDNVLLFTEKTWLSLHYNGRTSQFSAWLSGLDKTTAERLKLYYELNPERLPRYVFAMNDEIALSETLDLLDVIFDACDGLEIIEYENSYVIKLNA